MIMQNSILDSSSNDMHESDSYISTNCCYNEKSSSQHFHNSFSSPSDPQVINKVNKTTNAQEFSVVVDTQTNLHPSIQHDQPLHVCDMEISVDVQFLEQSTSSLPIMGNKPVTTVLLGKNIMKMIFIMERKLQISFFLAAMM